MPEIQPYISKYPFCADAKGAIGEFETKRIFEGSVIERAIERVKRGVNNGITGQVPNSNDDDVLTPEKNSDYKTELEVELLSYPAARLIVSMIGDYRVINQYARAEARTARKRLVEFDFSNALREENQLMPRDKRILSLDEVLDEYGFDFEQTTPADEFHRTYTAEFLENADDAEIRQFAEDVFSISSDALPKEALTSITPEELHRLFLETGKLESFSTTLHQVPFEQYLSVSKGFTDESWSLTNRGLSDGSLVVTNKEMLKLIEEAIYTDIKDELPLDVPEGIREELEIPAKEAEDSLEDSSFAYEIDRVEKGVFPPLIKSLISDFPWDLKHEEKVTLAAFLFHIGMNVDEMLEFLGVAGTPGESPTRYQLNHISTGGGNGEPYTPANYDTIESWGYEWEKDALEESVKNPLSYYKIKLQDESSNED